MKNITIFLAGVLTGSILTTIKDFGWTEHAALQIGIPLVLGMLSAALIAPIVPYLERLAEKCVSRMFRPVTPEEYTRKLWRG